jgi:hypothetical protein
MLIRSPTASLTRPSASISPLRICFSNQHAVRLLPIPVLLQQVIELFVLILKGHGSDWDLIQSGLSRRFVPSMAGDDTICRPVTAWFLNNLDRFVVVKSGVLNAGNEVGNIVWLAVELGVFGVVMQLLDGESVGLT